MRDVVLGISGLYHDAAAALIVDGELVAAAQEERFTRVKGDPRFPVHAALACLEEAALRPADLTCVAYYDQPLLTFDRLLSTHVAVAPRALGSWMRSMSAWLGRKLFVPSMIRETLGYHGEVIATPHHLAHAASAFYPSPFDQAAVLTIDGVGEWATATWGVGRGHDLALDAELAFPDSLGLLYAAFTAFCGFKVNAGEYKLMGLAPYGEPRYADLILRELVDVKPDGSLRLNQRYFAYCEGTAMTTPAFADLFGGPPRAPEAWITRREMDLAASIQRVTELVVTRMAAHVHRETGQRDLCLAGGVALNCVAVGRLLREGPFERVWVQPAAGDAGGALGAALAVYHGYLGRSRTTKDGVDHQRGSYLGPSFSEDEIRSFLETYGCPARPLPPETRAETVARAVADGKVVGYFSGRMEFGPRALGARSILGDPRRAETQAVMNQKIKFRESFRPFAPAVLRDRMSDWFAFDGDSPYMLLVAPVRAERRRPRGEVPEDGDLLVAVSRARSDIPAVTHWDYSARLQTVDGVEQRDFYDVIQAFHDMTGCPLVVNTSFNVRGEPIVCTPYDAYRCFMRTEMDALYLEGFWLEKDVQHPWHEVPLTAAAVAGVD